MYNILMYVQAPGVVARIDVEILRLRDNLHKRSRYKSWHESHEESQEAQKHTNPPLDKPANKQFQVYAANFLAYCLHMFIWFFICLRCLLHFSLNDDGQILLCEPKVDTPLNYGIIHLDKTPREVYVQLSMNIEI